MAKLKEAAYQKYLEGYVVMSIKPCWVRKATSPVSPIKLSEDYSVPYATRSDTE